MKKIAASLGLVALSAVSIQSVQAAYTPGLDAMQTSKAWNVAGTLRGFYDDNYTTAHSGPDKQSSYGFELSPSFSFNIPLQQTLIGGSYIYSMKYYEDRSDNKYDQTHQVDLWLNHAFSERYTLDLRDSFVSTQEPTLMDPGVVSQYTRTDGDNIRNTATAIFRGELTREFGTELGYRNTFYDYQQDNGTALNPSHAGLLNRMEHNAWANLLWKVKPTTTAFIGYQARIVDYTDNQPIALSPVAPYEFYSKDRNNISHIGYLGLEHSFSPNFSTRLEGGVQYTDYYDDPTDPSAEYSPYIVTSAQYTYGRGSYVRFGTSHSRNQTDVTSVDAGGHITLDQESTAAFATINHAFTPQLIGNLTGRFQNSTYNGGAVDGDNDQFYIVDANLAYHINKHLSVETGYAFDSLQSEAQSGYNRNRVYLGITAAY